MIERTVQESSLSFGRTIFYFNLWCMGQNCRHMIEILTLLHLSIQMVFWTVILRAVSIRKWWIGFRLRTMTRPAAPFSNQTVLKYWQEQYSDLRICDLQTSACMKERYSSSLQFVLRACHIQLTVCAWCSIVSRSTIYFSQLPLSARSHDPAERPCTSFL